MHQTNKRYLSLGPRFALVLLQYYLHSHTRPTLASVVLGVGLVRTLSCGGWVYITSSDDHDVHDIFMILYMVCNLPWMLGGIVCTPGGTVKRKRSVSDLDLSFSMGRLTFLTCKGLPSPLRRRCSRDIDPVYLILLNPCIGSLFPSSRWSTFSFSIKFIGYLAV